MTENTRLIINENLENEGRILEPVVSTTESGSDDDDDGAFGALGALQDESLVKKQGCCSKCMGATKKTLFCCCARSGKLGMINGVFVPTTLNIFGVILFLRLTLVVGQVGMWGAILEMVVAYTVTGLTTVSIAAICSNGQVKGGGAYYMLSRSIGPEIGGAVGIVFYLGAVAGGCTYVMGFAESFITAFGGWPFYYIFPGMPGTPYSNWWMCLYALSAMTLLFVIVFIGAQTFADTSIGIFVVLIVAMYFSMFSFVFQRRDYTTGYTGWNWDTLIENFRWTTGYDTEGQNLNFFKIFGIMFPACTGIMAGINLSGDLKNPSRDIPVGSFIAVGYTFVSYVLLIVILAGTTMKQSLLTDYTLTQKVTPFPLGVSFGIFAAALSSCLSNFIGAAKVLQAVAKDDLLPCMCLFAKGFGKNNEPRIGVIFTYLLMASIVLIAAVFHKDLNWTAPYATQFHIIAYGFTNLACFILSITGAPNFRPLYKYYHWTLALIGMIACFVSGIFCDYVSAAISVVVLLIVMVIIHFYAAKKKWGNVTQAIIYHQVRKYLLKLDSRKDNTKYWRFQPLLLITDPGQSLPLILFINNLKKGGAFILGTVKIGSFEDRIDDILQEHEAWLDFMTETKVKAFPEIAVGRNFREGAQNLMMIGGIGAMKPNALILEFYDMDYVDDDFRDDTFIKDMGSGGVGYGDPEMGDGTYVVQAMTEDDKFKRTYSPSKKKKKYVIRPLPGLGEKRVESVDFEDFGPIDDYEEKQKEEREEEEKEIKKTEEEEEEEGEDDDDDDDDKKIDIVVDDEGEEEDDERKKIEEDRLVDITGEIPVFVPYQQQPIHQKRAPSLINIVGREEIDKEEEERRRREEMKKEEEDDKQGKLFKDDYEEHQHEHEDSEKQKLLKDEEEDDDDDDDEEEEEHEEGEEGLLDQLDDDDQLSTVSSTPSTYKLTSLENFPKKKKEDLQLTTVSEYVNTIRDGFMFGKSVLVAVNFKNLHRHLLKPSNVISKVFARKTRYIDLWIPKGQSFDDHDVVLTLQLGFIINQVKQWKRYHRLRLFYVVDSKHDVGLERVRMKKVLQQYRISGTEVYAVPLENSSHFHILEKYRYDSLNKESKVMILNDLMKQFSRKKTSFIFTTLWKPPKKESEYRRYLKQIKILTDNVPPVLLIHGIENVISINL